jgi:hypothetical protein
LSHSGSCSGQTGRCAAGVPHARAPRPSPKADSYRVQRVAQLQSDQAPHPTAVRSLTFWFGATVSDSQGSTTPQLGLVRPVLRSAAWTRSATTSDQGHRRAFVNLQANLLEARTMQLPPRRDASSKPRCRAPSRVPTLRPRHRPTTVVHRDSEDYRERPTPTLCNGN